tara:strand:- start:357 stop:740 length:384 start_codon:yes stop_codon:yes gene_type:complete
MAIKKTIKMSAAPKKVVAKKVVAKKADPGKGVVAGAVATAKKIASTKYKPKTDETKAAYYQGKKRDAEYGMKVSKEMYKDEKMNDAWRMAGVYSYEKDKKIAKAATDSTKKYTQKSLENIKNLNRKK